MKLLLVDDEIEILEIISTLIESEIDCEVIKVETGNQAIALLERDSSIDIILSDYNMPDGNGGVLFNYNKKNKNIPFLFISGGYLEDFSNVSNFYEANKLNSFIHKPIDFDDMINAITKVMKLGVS